MSPDPPLGQNYEPPHERRPTNDAPRTAPHEQPTNGAPRKRPTEAPHEQRPTNDAPRTAHHGRRTTDGAPRTAHERRPTEAPHEQRPTDGAPQDGGGRTDDADGKGPSVPKALPLTALASGREGRDGGVREAGDDGQTDVVGFLDDE
ncbi:hypothetical protein BD779DRAFT_1678932 [Infundibulicybe gibba]|nr:hypothetical protein BD779DRAFT_1678932 [Infundibulicybe gibba]